MAEKLPVSDSSKPSQQLPSSAGQYVPQVFMVPYYAPHPGFNNFPSSQQHPAMYGQIPGTMHPSPMPLHGMPSPMPMPAIAVPSASRNSPPPATAGASKIGAHPRMTGTIKGTVDQNSPAIQSRSGHEEVSQKHNQQSNNHHSHIPRACWTHVEEEILVNIYSEYTLGKRVRKMTKITWEAIAERLYRESREQLPQVTRKTWMQCKDKWNNMVKKHKYYRSEYLIRVNNADHHAVERGSIFEAFERILNHENQPRFCNSFDQSNTDNDDERATMVIDNERMCLESNEDKSYETQENSYYDEGIHTPDRGQTNEEQTDSTIQVPAEDNHDHDEGDHGFEHAQMRGDGNLENVDVSSSSHEQSLKRARTADDDDDDQGAYTKYSRVGDSTHEVNGKLLYDVLLRQTELLERSHVQHNELLEQIRISEENTRMMILQAIKDLRTILDRLIKPEQK